MVHPLLAYSTMAEFEALSLHDRVQIALAIADESLLRSLLTDCTPPIALPDCIGRVSTTVGIPLEGAKRAADCIMQYEAIHCILADSPPDLEQQVRAYSHRNGNYRGYVDLTRCEADTRTIGQALTLAQAIALLNHTGFSPRQVQEILHLPQEGWYKSWWYSIDAAGQFTVPFLRLIRTLHYVDGTCTLQYKDFFAQDKPTCFSRLEKQVIIEINSGELNFRETLEKINYTRQKMAVDQAILICNRLSSLEAKGFMSQGISIYTAMEAEVLASADCAHCARANCPMHGVSDSPVVECQQFCLEGETED